MDKLKMYRTWVLLVICIWGFVKSDEYSYELPSLETLPNMADATSPQAKEAPFDPSILAHEDIKNNSQTKRFKAGKFGTAVDPSWCIKGCSGNGECQAVIKNTHGKTQEYVKQDIIYVCICEPNFINHVCSECRSGYYGPNCLPCPRNPADNEIWGKFGVCDDGLRGDGKCYCEDSDLEPSLYCESASHETLHQEEEDFTWGFFLLLLVVFVSLILLYLYTKVQWLETFPESIAAVVLGILIGLFFKARYNQDEEGLLKFLQFEPHTYFLFMLPPIMFQVGFSMNAATFFRNFLTINSYAVLGTFVSSVIFSLIFYYGQEMLGVAHDYLDWLQFGCIISAIDPVATISIFKSLRINDRIYMIVFGESTLNNAVAIALATSIEGIKVIIRSGDEVDVLDISVFTFEKFCTYFFLSFIIGAVWAIIISFVFAISDLHEFSWIEIAFFVLSCYFPYIFCESVGCSGVISIFVSGSVMRHYAFRSLGRFGKITIEYLVDTVGFTTEKFVFAYLGISIPLTLQEFNYSLTLLGILALMISRSLAVFISSYVVNIFGRKRIPFSHQIVFIVSGLRGAVAFYLALNFLSYQKSTLFPWVISIIIFTVIGLGSTTAFVIKLLDRFFPDDEIFRHMDFSDAFEIEKSVHFEDKDYETQKDGKPHSTGVITKIGDFDEEFLQRLLRRPGWEEDEAVFPFDELDKNNPNVNQSIEERFSNVMKITNRGGDLSPYRNSIMCKKNIPKEISQPGAGQLSFMDNFSKMYSKDEPFVTPNKGAGRRSINFRNREVNSYRNFNLLHISHMMNDNNIDYSMSRRKSMRKSMRMLSQRKSREGSRSDMSYPRQKDNKRTSVRAGSSFSPVGQQDRPYEQPRRLNEVATMPFNVNQSRHKNEREEYLSDRLSGPNEQAYVHNRDVVLEAEEAEEDEKHKSEDHSAQKSKSANNSRQQDSDEDKKRRQNSKDIKVDNDW